MLSNCEFRRFVIVLALCASGFCFKLDEHRRIRTKVNNSTEYSDNSYSDSQSVKTNLSSQQIGRGFFPPTNIFTLGKVLNFFPVGGERECRPRAAGGVSGGGAAAATGAGICLNPYDCRQREGRAAGDCALGFGVCCVFEVSCGGVVQNNLTWFVSPGFPAPHSAGDCAVSVELPHAGITQLRVDFVHFNIGQPNRGTGECDEDVMILGDKDNEFRLCGQNHGQHIYYTLPTPAAGRATDELGAGPTLPLRLALRGARGPRLWLLRLTLLPLAHAAPHDCLQYHTERNGTIMTFNYASNGRHLSAQQYRACIRKDVGVCSVRYTPCDQSSFRIGGSGPVNLYGAGPGLYGGPGTGFYGPDGSFVPVSAPAPVPAGTAPAQEVVDVPNDPVDDMVAMDPQNQDELEGSGLEPDAAAAEEPPQTLGSMILSYILPSWLWGQGSSEARTWFWSPYAQHYSKADGEFLYQGYGNFGIGFKGYGRQRCQDRITIPCDNEYFVENDLPYLPGVCDPHHCGQALCPGVPFSQCAVQTSVAPFAVSVHFGRGRTDNADDSAGACLLYEQMPCES